MFLPISCIFLGIALGLILKRTVLPKLAERLFMPIVCALLFAMGCVAGGNGELMANLPALGLQALALAVAAIIGSVLCVCLVSRFLPPPAAGLKGAAQADSQTGAQDPAVPAGKGRAADGPSGRQGGAGGGRP